MIKVILPSNVQVSIGEVEKDQSTFRPPRAPRKIEQVPHPAAPDSWSVYVDGTLQMTAYKGLRHEEVQIIAERQYPSAETITVCDHRE